jgi:hypothetical protein
MNDSLIRIREESTMARNSTGFAVANGAAKQHSSQLQRNLAEMAKSLAGRPQELRGPFALGAEKSNATSSGRQVGKK